MEWFEAAATGDASRVRELMCAGADLDAVDGSSADVCTYNRTALHVASSGGHCEVVRVLLERGARVDACD